MRKTRFTESQIVGILKEVEAGRTVQEVCREYGVSRAAYYKWKSKYGGMELFSVRAFDTESSILLTDTPG